MDTEAHAERTLREFGLRAEEIHRWIDGLFDREGFTQFLREGHSPDYDPYAHRKFRHCAEALDDAYAEFEGAYTREQIAAVFEMHVRDDYDGYLPSRSDFETGTFAERYHEAGVAPQDEPILSTEELRDYFRERHDRAASAARTTPGIGFYLRIVLPTAIALALFVGTAFLAIVPAFSNTMRQQKRTLIRELTTAAASEIQYFIAQEQRGELTREVAQQMACEDIRSMRYGAEGGDYFWITDMHPTMVMHPYQSDLEGQDLTDYREGGVRGGRRLFVELAALVAAEGEGYLEYRWQQPGAKASAVPKLSYVKAVPEWGWIVGTGVYLDDVQHEVGRLTEGLTTFFTVVSLGLSLLLVTVIWQSRKIERQRLNAERGLREAKDRYRALVEASTEGHLLQLGGVTVYANRTLLRLLNCKESDLLGLPASEVLGSRLVLEPGTIEKIAARGRPGARPMQFTGRVAGDRTPGRELIVSSSRIFLSETSGQIFTFRPALRSVVSPALELMAAAGDCDAQALPSEAADIVAAIGGAAGMAGITEGLTRLPGTIYHVGQRGAHPNLLREAIGEAFDAAVRRIFELAAEAGNLPAVPFAFLSLGSNGRHEMTMYSDQDNAIVFADVPAEQLDVVRRRMLTLADSVCSLLNQAGFPYCPGGILASNPAWCLSMSEWRTRIMGSVQSGERDAVLDLHVLLDMRPIYGDLALAEPVRAALAEAIAGAPAVLPQLATEALRYRPPLAAIDEATRKPASTATLNIKEALKALESFARLYAARAGVVAAPTLQRVLELERAGLLEASMGRDVRYAFNALWQLRLRAQLEAGLALRSDQDALPLAPLGQIERETVRAILVAIQSFQRKLSYDFCGVDLVGS